MAGQYLTFHINSQELTAEQAQQNWTAGHPEIMEEVLLGTGTYSDLVSQLTLLDQAYQQMVLTLK